jgi:hypothetical protein
MVGRKQKRMNSTEIMNQRMKSRKHRAIKNSTRRFLASRFQAIYPGLGRTTKKEAQKYLGAASSVLLQSE